jgi:hypothetical protein
MMKNFRQGMMEWMSKRMIACDEASFLVSYSYDNKLGFGKRMRLKMHLLSCHLCRKYASQIHQLQHALEKYREGCTGDICHHHLSDHATERMEEAVTRERET